MRRLTSALSALLITSGSLRGVETLVVDPAQFEAAVKVAKAGDVIVLAEGEWRDADLRFKAHGTAAEPVTLRARTPGKTILTGKSRVRAGGEHLVVEGIWIRDPLDEEGFELRIDSKLLARDCRVTQCAVTSTMPATKAGNSARFGSVYGGRKRIDHGGLAGKTTKGATLVVWLPDDAAGSAQHRIDHNFFGPRAALGENGGETIRVGDSESSLQDARCVVEGNLFERCNGEGEIISNKSCANAYRRNVFIECEGALTLRHGHRCVVEGNWFIGNHKRMTGGVRIVGEDHVVRNNHLEDLEGDDFRCGITFMAGIPTTPLNGYSQVKRALVTNNTLVSCKHSILIGMMHDKKCTLPPVQTRIENNLVVNAKRALVSMPMDGSDVHWEGNVMHGRELGISARPGINTQAPTLRRDTTSAWRAEVDGTALGATMDKRVTRASTGPSWQE